MRWCLHRVSLAAHDLAQAQTFFGNLMGLGAATKIGSHDLGFGAGSRGLRVRKPMRTLSRIGEQLIATAGARHVAIGVDDLNSVVSKLDKAAIASVDAPAGDFDVPAIYTLDPAMNVVAFCQEPKESLSGDFIQPWEKAWGWGVHHVNLQANDVREAVGFYVEIAGLTEGRWRAPDAMGDFSTDPKELAVLPLGAFNRGIHIIRPDPGFALRNGFAHNPSIGGHPAFVVADIEAVKVRMEKAGLLVSDAGVYAMFGMHQLYMLDPSGNVIEINQFVS